VERALELWPQVPDAAERCGCEHAEVLRWAAELAYLVNDPRRAVALLEAALAAHATDADRLGRALVLQRLGLFRSVSGDEAGALDACAEAVELVQELPPSSARAQVLARYSHLLMVWGRHSEATGYGNQALEDARTVGDRAVEGQVLGTLGASLAALGDEHGLTLLRRARQIAEQLDRPEEVLRTDINETASLGGLGRDHEAIEVASRGIARARELGLKRFWEGLTANMAWSALYLGRWELVDEAVETVSGDVGGWAAASMALLVPTSLPNGASSPWRALPCSKRTASVRARTRSSDSAT
jgi:tetratricopeptide (TPR) repeat protein